MEIRLSKNSSMFGMNPQNLKISQIKNFLAKQGVAVSFPDSETAIIQSPGPLMVNQEFQLKIQELEKDYQEHGDENDNFINELMSALVLFSGIGILTFNLTLALSASFDLALFISMISILVSFATALYCSQIDKPQNTLTN